MTQLAEQFITRFMTWAQSRPDIRAAFVAGSYGRTSGDHQADEWSDLDILFTTQKPKFYLDVDNWLHELGTFWTAISVPDDPFPGFMTSKSIFTICEGGLAVDFAVLPLRRTLWWLRALRVPAIRQRYARLGESGAVAADIVRRGVRVLFDKDDFVDTMRKTLLALPEAEARPPSPAKFTETIRDYWYGPVVVARHLRRGEVYESKGLMDRPQKRLLYTMVEWHSRSKTGWGDGDTWYRPKFIEHWADPRVIAAFPTIFGPYDQEAIWGSLFASMTCFQWLSRETAQNLNYDFPPVADDEIVAWVRGCHEDRKQEST